MSFHPSKHLGQNFLVNRGVVEKIISAAELSKQDTVLEVGPGKGILTEELIKHAGRVIAVEKDKRMYEMLMDKFKNVNNSILVNADILRFNFQFPISNFQSISKFQIPNFKKYKIVANIPYNITGQFFRKFLLAEHRPSMIVVMVQKEVGERLLGKNKSILSLAASLYGRAEKICDVSPGSFSPPPKVTSMVVKLISQPYLLSPSLSPRRRGPEGQYSGIQIHREMERRVLQIAKIGFASRRKKLVSNLSTGLKISKEKLLDIFSKIGLGANVRAEELGKDDWLKFIPHLFE